VGFRVEDVNFVSVCPIEGIADAEENVGVAGDVKLDEGVVSGGTVADCLVQGSVEMSERCVEKPVEVVERGGTIDDGCGADTFKGREFDEEEEI
jgi:hypothetical protein